MVKPLLSSHGAPGTFTKRRMQRHTKLIAHTPTDSQLICSLAHTHTSSLAHSTHAPRFIGMHAQTHMHTCSQSHTHTAHKITCIDIHGLARTLQNTSLSITRLGPSGSFSSGQCKLQALPEAMPHMPSSSSNPRRQSERGGVWSAPAHPQTRTWGMPTQLWGHSKDRQEQAELL